MSRNYHVDNHNLPDRMAPVSDESIKSECGVGHAPWLMHSISGLHRRASRRSHRGVERSPRRTECRGLNSLLAGRRARIVDAPGGASLRNLKSAAMVLSVWSTVGLLAQPVGPSKPGGTGSPGGQAIGQGRTTYNRYCTACHGVNGMVGTRGPALAGRRNYTRSTDSAIFDAIANGISGSGMPPSGLPPAEIRNVVAYIRDLRASASDTFVPGNPEQGSNVFWTKGDCGACHMIGGRGGISGPDLSNIGAERTLDEIQGVFTERHRRIVSGYESADVVTVTGERFSGIIKNEDNFSLEMLDLRGHLKLFSRDELREIRYRKASPMPTNYRQTLSPAELQNLIAFLSHQTRDKPEDTQEGEPGQ